MTIVTNPSRSDFRWLGLEEDVIDALWDASITDDKRAAFYQDCLVNLMES